jgi:hypothetical protein
MIWPLLARVPIEPTLSIANAPAPPFLIVPVLIRCPIVPSC